MIVLILTTSPVCGASTNSIPAERDADVVQVVEEHEVTRLQLVARHRHAEAELGGREVGERDAELRVDVHHEA